MPYRRTTTAGGSGTSTASGVAFTPTGTIAASDVQAAIAEAASEAAQKSANLSDLASAATARTNLGVAATRPVTTKTAAYTAVDRDIVLADATSAAFAVTLPAGGSGKTVTVKKIDSSANGVTITPASGTIDGAASVTVTTQYASRDVVSDGTNWFIV